MKLMHNSAAVAAGPPARPDQGRVEALVGHLPVMASQSRTQSAYATCSEASAAVEERQMVDSQEEGSLRCSRRSTTMLTAG